MKKNILILSVLLFVVFAMAAKLYSNKLKSTEDLFIPDTTQGVAVDVVEVASEEKTITLAYIGTFLPNREVMLVPQMPGKVTTVLFDEGQLVREGDLLLQLDDEMLRIQHAAALADFENARSNAQRYQQASASEGISKIQLDNSTLQLAHAEAQLKQLEKSIRMCQLNASFTGTITQKNIEPGSMAGTMPIAQLTDMSFLKLEIKIPEQEITLLPSKGQVDVYSDMLPGVTMKGMIDYISDKADQAHQFTAKILIDNRGRTLKAGTYGSVRFSLTSNGVFIPRTSLVGSAKQPQVYLMENGKAVMHNINIGKSLGNSIKVLEGLKKGDLLVTSGIINVSNNTLITLKK